MRNLSAAQTECSAKVMAHNGCLSGAHLWILGWEATFLCSGRTSFISGSDRVIGEHAIAFATLALSPSALLPRSTSRAASACPPTHTLPPYFTPLISCSLYLWCPRSCGYNEADCEGRRETTAAALRILFLSTYVTSFPGFRFSWKRLKNIQACACLSKQVTWVQWRHNKPIASLSNDVSRK